MFGLLFLSLLLFSQAIGEFKTVWKSDSDGQITIRFQGSWNGNYSYGTNTNECNTTENIVSNSDSITLSGLEDNTDYLVCFDSGFVGLINPGSQLYSVKEWGNTTWGPSMLDFF